MRNQKYILILICLGIVFFILGNNVLSLTNPDEVFYVLSAKEMATHNTWLVPYIFNQPQFEKPVFTFWFLRLSFIVFGPTSFAARFIPAIFAVLGCAGTYWFCRLCYRDEHKAFFCSTILLSAGFYVAMARVVMTDMVFSVLVALSMFSFYSGYVHARHRSLGLFGFFFFCALAVLTKGLLGLVFPWCAVVCFLISRRDVKFLYTKSVFKGIAIFFLVALPWYVFILSRYKMDFINEFIYNDHIRRILEAEHANNDRWYFYPLTITLGMLPWSIFTLLAFFNLAKRGREVFKEPLQAFLIIWIAIVFVVCQIAHSKLASYVLPAFPAVAILTGDYLWDLVKTNKKRLYVIVGLTTFPFIAFAMGLLLISLGKIPLPVEYYDYVPGKIVALSFLFTTGIISFVTILFAFKQKKRYSLYALALQIPSLIFLAFGLHNNYEPYVSSKEVSAVLLKQPDNINTVLCSKMFARGVRYYSNKDIAVIGPSYFSPHPVPMLNSEKQILEFLSNEKEVLAVLKKSDLKRIKDAVVNKFKVEEIKQVGDEYVVKISLAV